MQIKKKIFDYFHSEYLKNKDSILINIENKNFTYEYIYDQINLIENNILNKETKKIGIIEHNNVLHVILYLLCSKNNLSFVPFDPEIVKKDLLNQIKISKCNVIFCSSYYKNIIPLKVKRYNIEYNFKEKKNILKNYFYKKNFFLLCFTSGSTGNPKPIALSQKTKILRAKSNIDLYSLQGSKKSVISTPFHHTLAIRILTISIILGLKIYVIKNYNFKKFISIIDRYKIDFTIFISTQINDLISDKKYFKKIKKLNSIISSSSNLSFKNKEKISKLFNGKIFECYGLSEAAIVTSLDIKKHKTHLGSVGKVIKNVKIKILGIKKRDKVGEILVKSKYIFSEYLNQKKFTNKQFVNKYFKTGDLGYLRDNFLYLVGRKKNMFKIKGISVYGEDIEKKVLQLKFVSECFVTSITNIKDEENICLIYSSKNSKNLDLKVKKFCLKNLSIFQIPRHYIFTNEIPKNKLGKPDRVKLDKLIEEL